MKVQPRSVSEGCSACRRMEESSLAGYRSIDAYREAPCVKMCKDLEIVSAKKKRVQRHACALTQRTTVDGRSYKFRSNERLGWLAPARQSLLHTPYKGANEEEKCMRLRGNVMFKRRMSTIQYLLFVNHNQ